MWLFDPFSLILTLDRHAQPHWPHHMVCRSGSPLCLRYLHWLSALLLAESLLRSVADKVGQDCQNLFPRYNSIICRGNYLSFMPRTFSAPAPHTDPISPYLPDARHLPNYLAPCTYLTWTSDLGPHSLLGYSTLVCSPLIATNTSEFSFTQWALFSDLFNVPANFLGCTCTYWFSPMHSTSKLDVPPAFLW